MPSLRQIMLSLIVATLLSAPAAAQWFSDRPAQCPVGTSLSRSGKCVKGSRSSFQSASISLPRRAPRENRSRVVPPTKITRGGCPKGAYAMNTTAGVLCVPLVNNRPNAEKACSNFNGGFSRWYRAEVAEYEGLAKRNRDNETSMKQHIDRQKSLAKDLRRRVFRARHKGVRRELTTQWNALRRDIKSNEAHLAATKTKNRAQEAEWKESFKTRLKRKLYGRPAGCKVAAAG